MTIECPNRNYRQLPDSDITFNFVISISLLIPSFQLSHGFRCFPFQLSIFLLFINFLFNFYCGLLFVFQYADADMEDYGFEYSDEEPEEQDVDIENQYYNSKGFSIYYFILGNYESLSFIAFFLMSLFNRIEK